MKYDQAEGFWERAGETSYASAMFAASDVERHVNSRVWQTGIDIGHQLGLNQNSYILDLGCGDGALANLVLSKHFRAVDGYDLSAAAIKRAREFAPHENMKFHACDITKMDYSQLPQYDGAYLWGILHHVKEATPNILKGLHGRVKKIVILEPNGNHLLRKVMERTKSYKAAGEDSFRTHALETIFKQAGYHPVIWKRLNLFPNFTPSPIFKKLKAIEPFVENTLLLRSLCTVNMWGFVAYE